MPSSEDAETARIGLKQYPILQVHHRSRRSDESRSFRHDCQQTQHHEEEEEEGGEVEESKIVPPLDLKKMNIFRNKVNEATQTEELKEETKQIESMEALIDLLMMNKGQLAVKDQAYSLDLSLLRDAKMGLRA